MTTNPDPLLTVPEVANYLGVSAGLVRHEVAQGRLDGTWLGRLLRIRQSAVERYISAVTAQADDAS